MHWLLFVSLLAACGGNAMKQVAMKNCGKRAPGGFNSVCINMLRCLICVAVSLVFWAIAGFGATTLRGHLIIIIYGIGNALSVYAWILASRFIPMALLEIFNTIGGLVVPMILAPYLYNGDSVSLIQWIGCIILFISVFFFIDIDLKRRGKSPGKTENTVGNSALTVAETSSLPKKIAIVFTSAAGTGTAVIFQKYYVLHIESQGLGKIEYMNLMGFAVMVAVFLLLFGFFLIKDRATLIEEGKVKLPYKAVWMFVVLAAIGLYINQYFSAVASQFPSALYFPLSKGMTILASFLLDLFVYKDKFTVKKGIGILLVLISIVLVNL
ncbi:MAG: hypothetical protein IJY04_05760 [Clostridia bacterium]|nr:hypothetical protein [Clostridia bacterium]